MHTEPTPNDPASIYRQLKKGLGHELVNDGNVSALIQLARQDGHQLLEQELREWQASCAESGDGTAFRSASNTEPVNDESPLASLGKAISAPVREAGEAGDQGGQGRS